MRVCYSMTTDREGKPSVCLNRCYQESGLIKIPDQVNGCLVTRLSDYFFSAQMREEPTGQIIDLNEAKGQSLPPVCCGEMIEEISLPSSLESIGRYAFYNCSNLKKLKLASTIRDIGGGAFTGCSGITHLEILVWEAERSCLKEILSELTETVYVDYRVFGSDQRARLVFPAFYEEAVENTPARLLSTHTHGCGHRYRYCFYGTAFRFEDYDQVFPYAKTTEDMEILIELVLGRLMYPYRLTPGCAMDYELFLRENWIAFGEYLLKKEKIEAFRWMVKRTKFEHTSGELEINEGLPLCAREGLYNIGQSVLGKTEMNRLIELAGYYHKTWAVSFLMDEKHRLFPQEDKGFRF